MALSKETLAMLGLPENATDEEISAKVAELNSAKVKVEGERDNFKRSFDKTSSELATLKKEKMRFYIRHPSPATCHSERRPPRSHLHFAWCRFAVRLASLAQDDTATAVELLRVERYASKQKRKA